MEHLGTQAGWTAGQSLQFVVGPRWQLVVLTCGAPSSSSQQVSMSQTVSVTHVGCVGMPTHVFMWERVSEWVTACHAACCNTVAAE
jgi:hypothetical protein